MAKTEPDFMEENDVERRPSVLLPQLEEHEQQFFDLVAAGNISDVENFLKERGDFDVNSLNFQMHPDARRHGITPLADANANGPVGTDERVGQEWRKMPPDGRLSNDFEYLSVMNKTQGVSALHVAIRGRNLQMVKFLLSREVEVNDTVLHAVRKNEPQIVVLLLDRLGTAGLEFAGVRGSPEFLDETTPLGVAAFCGYYELIRLLLDRGHSLDKPHPPSCYCEEVCKPQRKNEDPLTLDKRRLFLYTAIANPAYICLTTEDPILTAFELSKELRKAAHYEDEFDMLYKELSDKVAAFAAELIGCARTSEEVELVLKQPANSKLSTQFIYPRLLMAMDYKMKTFVANENIQQLMEFKWMEGWYEWKLKSTIMKVFSVPPRIVMLPAIVFWVVLAPKSTKTKKWSVPVNKFISFTASYVVFLLFVYLESNIDKTNQLRGPPDSGFEIILVIYVVSYIWDSMRLCMIHGPERFFKTPWNWYETIMLLLFVLTFLFWATALIDVKRNGQRDLERKYWHEYDATLISEGTFCIAAIMAFFKVLFFCQLDHTLGPLQMSLGKMINDVAKFIIIFAIIIVSFSVGLVRFYQYYRGMIQVDDDTKLQIQQVDSFVNFSSTLKTLFWAIFCMSPIESADVVIENLPGESESETIINQHKFTEAVGYIAYATFQFISVIVVLNMLIACMSNTFIQVTDNVSVEWTFGRTEVYINFMGRTALPPPLNLIPTAGTFNAIAEFIKALMKPTAEKKARWNLKHCCYVENIPLADKEDFAIVMSQLVQRYFRKKETALEETDREKSLERELVELRSLLREALSPA